MFKKNITRKYKSRPYKIIHYCKHYVLEDNLEIIAFDKRFSDPKNDLRWVLRKRYNYTKRFLYAIIERIEDKSNVIIVIWGTPNSGKSEGAQIIAFYIRYIIWKYLHLKVKIEMAFSTADFQEITPNMKRGDIGIRDESSALSGAGARNTQADLNNITKAIRMEQNSFIFVDPTKITAKVVSFYLESAGKNKKTRKIRFILYDKDVEPLGHIYLPLHWSPLFRKKYKNKKQVNLDTLKVFGGLASAELPKRFEFDEKRLLQYCKKYPIKNKGDIEALLQRFNRQCEETKDMLKGDTHYIATLTKTVWLDIREERLVQKEKIWEKKRNIQFIQGDDFSVFVKMNLKDSMHARVGFGLCRGDSENTILGNNPDISHGKLNYIKEQLKNKGSAEIRLGYLFEKWFALNLGVPIEELDGVLGGTTNKPDLIFNDIIYSLKFITNRKARSITFSQSQKSRGFRPEFLESLKRGITYKLVFMNPAWSQDIQIIDVDPQGDDKVVVYKKKRKRLEF